MQTKWANELEKRIDACLKAEDPTEGVQALKDFMDPDAKSYKNFAVDMKQAYSVLSGVVNVMGRERENLEALEKAFGADHRTLQQSMMKLIFSLIFAVAEWPEYHFDGRNERMGKLCRVTKELLTKYRDEHPDEPDITWLPLI